MDAMILITGASGHLGKRAAELLAQQDAKLRLMSRSPEKAPQLEGAQIVPGSFEDPGSLSRAFAGVTTALIISGKEKPGERAKLHNNAFKAAAAARVKHIVYTSLKGAAADSVYPFCRDHYESERLLEATGVPHTILRNAFYIDLLFEKYDEHGVLRGPAADGEGTFVSREDASRAAAAAILSKRGGIIEVTGRETISLDDVSCRLSEIIGRELRYENEPAAATAARLRRSDMPEWRQETEIKWFEAIAAGEQAGASHGYQRLTGIQPLNLDQYCATFPNVLDHLRVPVRAD
jgi:NAD(P)H dehydrogenase (quinone)